MNEYIWNTLRSFPAILQRETTCFYHMSLSKMRATLKGKNLFPMKGRNRVIWAVPCENVSSGICEQWRPRSACASAQADLGLHCPLTESLATTECMNGEQQARWYFAHVHDDLNLLILLMFEGTFSLDVFHLAIPFKKWTAKTWPDCTNPLTFWQADFWQEDF